MFLTRFKSGCKTTIFSWFYCYAKYSSLRNQKRVVRGVSLCPLFTRFLRLSSKIRLSLQTFFVTLAYSPSYNALGIKNKQNERLSNAIYKGAGSAGAHGSSTSLFYCIGQGTNGTCGTVTIGGKVGYVKGRDYTYEPGN